MGKSKNKILFLSIMTFVFLILSFNNYNSIVADWIDPDEEIKENKEKKEQFLQILNDGGYGNTKDILKNLSKQKSKKQKDNSLKWYIQHLFSPGFYIEDVNNYIAVGEDVDDSVVHKVNNRHGNERYSLCYHEGEPQNLLNHNCDIPSFGTELFQMGLKNYKKSGIFGAERTSSKAMWGFGVPVGIPGGEVPINPKDRISKYTALELYGYNLYYTNYYGEWDDIQVVTEARMLSNIGYFDRFKLSAASIWNGVGGAIADYFNSWTFSPTKYGKKTNGFKGITDEIVATIVDTSDFYIVSTHSWKRQSFTNTLYNAYYMTDKEIINKSSVDFGEYFKANLFKIAETHPRIREVFYLMKDGEHWPIYNYNKEKWCKYRDKDTGKCLMWSTKPETWSKWKGKTYQVDYDKRGKAQNIDCFSGSNNYTELRTCWDVPWLKYAKKEANHDLPVMQQLMTKLENDFFSENKQYDVNRPFSHYICADEEGSPIGESLADYKYIYSKPNSRTKEFLNGCKPVRPSIKGGMFGNGEKKSDDTRFILYSKTGLAPGSSVNFFGTIGRSVSRFCAKMTNTLLSLSFSNIIEFLKISDMIESLITSFRDGIFFPLVALAFSITGIWLLFKAYKNSVGVIKTISLMVVIFIIGVSIMLMPKKIADFVEKVPSSIDNFILENTTNKDLAPKLCDATGNKASLRSLQCAIWEVTVFDPWIRGQWGTNYDNLNDKFFTNSNKDLVGTAEVDMGGGQLEHNWALWQLDKTKTGTITTDNPKILEGKTSKEVYKLVDLQAGPNHGEKSDSTYLVTWAGFGGDNRGAIQFFSGFVSVLLLFILGSLCIAKIETTFQLAFLIFVLPFKMLFAMLPNGTMKMLDYIGDIINLLLRRIFIVLIIVMSLQMLQAITSDSNTNYVILSIFIIAFLIAVKMYWKNIINMLVQNKSEITGMGALKEKANASNVLPKSLNMAYSRKKEMVKQGIDGAIGGAVVGTYHAYKERKRGIKRKDDSSTIITAIKMGAKRGLDRGDSMTYKKARRHGLGILSTLSEAEEVAKQSSGKDFFDERELSSTNMILAKDLLSMQYKRIHNHKTKIIKEQTKNPKEDPILQEEINALDTQLYSINRTVEALTGLTTHKNSHLKKLYETPDGRKFIKDLRKLVNSKEFYKDNEVNVDKIIKLSDNYFEYIKEYEQTDKYILEKEKEGLKKDIVSIKQDFKDPALKLNEKISETLKSDYQKDLEKYYKKLEEFLEYKGGLEYAKVIKQDFDKSYKDIIKNSEELAPENLENLQNIKKFHDDIVDFATKETLQPAGITEESHFDHKGWYKSADKFALGKSIELQMMKEGVLKDKLDELQLTKPVRANYNIFGKKDKDKNFEFDINELQEKTQSNMRVEDYVNEIPNRDTSTDIKTALKQQEKFRETEDEYIKLRRQNLSTDDRKEVAKFRKENVNKKVKDAHLTRDIHRKIKSEQKTSKKIGNNIKNYTTKTNKKVIQDEEEIDE